MPYEPLRPSRDASPELMALYNVVNKFNADTARCNERQDEQLAALAREIHGNTDLVRQQLEATLLEVRADRRERDATLAVVVGAAVRQAMADTLPALRGEFDASIKLLAGRLDEHDERFDRLHAEVAQCPTREEMDRQTRLIAANRHDLEEEDKETRQEITGAVANIRHDLYDEGGLEPRVRDLEVGPRTRSFAWKLAIGGAFASATPGTVISIIELVKQLREKIHP